MAAAMGLGKKALLAAAGAASAGGAALLVAVDESVRADLTLHAPKMKWSHSGVMDSLDHASVRRGYQVYKQVCSACHSMQHTSYRHLVNVMMSEDEAKAEAEEIQVVDGPDSDGNMFERPGKLTDYFPKPFANDAAAAAANNGAIPPDLSFIALARHGREDYIYHLLTSYCEAPAGVQLADGQHFNPYFYGGVIGMAPPLYNEIIEYEDGTPATKSQLAKDISTFLVWSASSEHDVRKKMAIKVMIFFPLFTALAYYKTRHVWAPVKNSRLVFLPRKYD